MWFLVPTYSTADVVATGLLSFGAGMAVGAMMSGGCCGWGYSSWNCNWYHGGGVYYGAHPYYGNSAWHGGYYGNGYDNSTTTTTATTAVATTPTNYNNGYNSSGYHANNYSHNTNVSGNTVNVNNANRQNASADRSGASASSRGWGRREAAADRPPSVALEITPDRAAAVGGVIARPALAAGEAAVVGAVGGWRA